MPSANLEFEVLEFPLKESWNFMGRAVQTDRWLLLLVVCYGVRVFFEIIYIF
jgi:hypothetical protein